MGLKTLTFFLTPDYLLLSGHNPLLFIVLERLNLMSIFTSNLLARDFIFRFI
jgi:hypothetical protein